MAASAFVVSPIWRRYSQRLILRWSRIQSTDWDLSMIGMMNITAKGNVFRR